MLADVLLRFRCYNYVLVADIEKTFHQISLNLDYRNLVPFLWFKDIENLDFECFENNHLIDYRFCRVLFGVISSLFLLAATSINHISKHENVDPLFVSKLMNSLHVDDITRGCNTVIQGLEFYENVKKC